jgi:hypothetical protein
MWTVYRFAICTTQLVILPYFIQEDAGVLTYLQTGHGRFLFGYFHFTMQYHHRRLVDAGQSVKVVQIARPELRR